MEKVGVEGTTLKHAIQAACEQLEATERTLRYQLDVEHFRDEFGKVRGVDTVRILAWKDESAAEEEPEEVKPPRRESSRRDRPRRQDASEDRAAPERKRESSRDSGRGSSRDSNRRRRDSEGSRSRGQDSSDRASEVGGEDPNATKDKLEYVESFVSGTLSKLGLEGLKVQLDAGEEGERSTVRISGKDNVDIDDGVLKRLMSSLEYLSNRLSPPQGGRGPRIAFDLGQGSSDNEKERALRAVAAKVVEQVTKRGKSLTIKPMNSYERRIIHMAVAEYEGVSSKSIGDGSRKKIKVFPTDEGDDD